MFGERLAVVAANRNHPSLQGCPYLDNWLLRACTYKGVIHLVLSS